MLSSQKDSVLWFRKAFLEAYFELLCSHIENERMIPENKIVSILSEKLQKGKKNRVEGWKLEREKKKILAKQENLDAACLLCDSSNLANDVLASRSLAQKNELTPLFNSLQKKTASEVVQLALFDLLWKLSFSKPLQMHILSIYTEMCSIQ